jgi:4-diphosphocytidyl-2-C-methyl-D-erythritol kinase
LKGRGEQVESFKTHLPLWFVLMLSDQGAATPSVYRMYDSLLKGESLGDRKAFTPKAFTPKAVQSLGHKNVQTLCQNLGNDLLPAAIKLQPEIEENFKLVQSCGALGANMTGSGSCVYAVFADKKQAQSAQQTFKNKQTLCIPSVQIEKGEENG